MHGYEMVKTLEQASRGVLTFKEGTLYPTLEVAPELAALAMGSLVQVFAGGGLLKRSA